ncbi:MAG: WD40 repeat domain-containing protein [Thermoguttaceae bacterium]
MSTVKVVLLDPKTVIYLFNLAVAASLACGVGLFASRVCRRRSAPVRHGILVGKLALVLLSPGAVWLGQQIGLAQMQVAVSDEPDSASFSERVRIEPLPGPISVERSSSVSTGTEQSFATESPRIPSAASGDSLPWKPAPATEPPSQGVCKEEYSSIPPVPVQPGAVCWWQVFGTMLAQRESTRFAQTLVELAARATTQRFQPAALGILEPAALIGRVTRLLNKERNMATRMSSVSTVLVLTWTGVVLLAIVLAGGLRAEHSGVIAEETAVAAGDGSAVPTVEGAKTEKVVADHRAPAGPAAVLGGEPVRFLSEPELYPIDPQEVRRLEFSPDGKLLATAHGWQATPGAVRLWDLNSRRLLATYPSKRGCDSLSFSPDGQRLAATSWDRKVRVIDVATRQIMLEFAASDSQRVVFAPDGKTIATATERTGEVHLRDPVTGKPLRSFKGEMFDFLDVTFSPDGRFLAACGGNLDQRTLPGRVCLWETDSGRQVKVFVAHQAFVNGVRFSPDGKTLATTGQDHTIRLWDVATWRMKRQLHVPEFSAGKVRFSPNGKLFASVCMWGPARLWDAETGVQQVELPDGPHVGVAFSPDGKVLAFGGESRVVRFWDIAGRREIGVLDPVGKLLDPPQPILSVAYSPDGRSIASAHMDGTVRFRSADSGKVERVFRGDHEPVAAVVFSPDGKYLAGAAGNNVRLWSVAGGQDRAAMKGHGDSIFSLAFSPDGRTLASAAGDRTVRLWDVARGVERARLEGHTAPVRSVAFSPDGTLLASAADDRSVRLWSVAILRSVALLEGHAAPVAALAFSPDGKTLASASEDRTIKLWDVAARKQRATLRAHSRVIWCLTFSPGGRTLASAGNPGFIELWDPESGTVRETLAGHSNLVTSLAFAPAGRALLSASYDCTMKRWRPDQAAQEDAQETSKGRLEEMRRQAVLTNVQLRQSGQATTAKLVPEPLWRYHDRPRNIVDGTLWCWTCQGRPVAFEKIERCRLPGRPNWLHAFASFAPGTLAAVWPGDLTWSSARPGRVLSALPGGSPAAANGPARLRQMEQLARGFQVVRTEPNVTENMRFLAPAIYRYSDAASGLQDGALFALASNGTNPDLLLAIELHGKKAAQAAWSYALVRMTLAAISVSVQGHEVWSAPYLQPTAPLRPTHFETWTYFWTSGGKSQK